jgi:hypothetical protein
MLGDRRIGFLYGVAAGALFWTGLDGWLSRTVERRLALPAGGLGDFLALMLVLIWAVATAALAWRGLASGRGARRKKAPQRRRRSGQPAARKAPARRPPPEPSPE